MKKITAIIISSMLILCMTACSEKEEEPSENESSSEITSSVSETSKEETQTMGSYLSGSFGRIWGNGTFYIDYTMTVEYFDRAENSEESSSEEYQDENQEENQDEESENKSQRVYEITIASDSQNKCAGLKMVSEEDTVNLVVSGGKCYSINSDGTYTSESYSDDVSSFVQDYTTNMGLGLIENLKLDYTSQTEYSGSSVIFESYKIEKSEQLNISDFDDISVTYYFNSVGIPISEVMETPNGKTTFTIKTLSDQIEDRSIIQAPN